MNKKELAAALRKEFNLTGKEANAIVSKVFEAIVEALKQGEPVRILGFGTFSVRNAAPRKARNPRTGEIIEIPSRKTVKFTPSQKLKEVVADG